MKINLKLMSTVFVLVIVIPNTVFSHIGHGDVATGQLHTILHLAYNHNVWLFVFVIVLLMGLRTISRK